MKLFYSIKTLIGSALAFLAALLLVVGLAYGQEEADEAEGLVPTFGDGRLVVSGSDLQPGEEVGTTLTLKDGPARRRQVMTAADRQGLFRVDTGLVVAPATGIGLEAHGNRGALNVAMTTAPFLPATRPADPADFALPDGWFYTQASGQPGLGFAVTDEAGVQFWSEFQRLGSVAGVGYPISQRFVWDGFVSQAFQKMVFQWRPEVGRVYAINVIDLIHEAGLDGWLQVVRATPPIADWSSDGGRTWPQIVAAHQALLTDSDIRAAYYAVDDPVTLYGLPMAPIQNMGNVLVLRMQRGIIQQWLVDVPWARAGQVTAANSGDVAKEAELLPTGALQPVAAPRQAGPGAPPSESPLQVVLQATPVTTAGEPVQLTLRVTNAHSDTVYWWTGNPVADFVAERDGVEIWRWSHGQAFTLELRRMELGPGETLTFEQSWPLVDNVRSRGRVPAGEYALTGILTASPGSDPTDPREGASSGPIRTAPVRVTVR